MNGIPSTEGEAGWSCARWAFVLTLLVAAQVTVVLWLTHWPRLAVPVRDAAGSFRLEFPGADAAVAGQIGGDPRQFALGDPQGFSGSAWRALPPAEYALAEWQGRPRWLAVTSQPVRLGAIPAGNPAPEARPLVPPPVILTDDVRAPRMLATNTVVVPSGPLAELALHADGPVPVWTGPELLSPTVVEVGVTPEGEVLIARVTGTSGNRDADRLALDWAQRVRFPGPTVAGPGSVVEFGQLTWSELAFVWYVQPSLP